MACPRPHGQPMAKLGPAPGHRDPGARAPFREGPLGTPGLARGRPRSSWTPRPGGPRARSSTHGLLSQGGAVRSVMMASSGTRWDSLGTPSPASGASAVGTWTPTPWATATPCPAAACVACTTRRGPSVTSVRTASMAVLWPLGPRTNACVSPRRPARGVGAWAPSPPGPAGAPRGCAARGSLSAFSVSRPESARLRSAPRSFQPRGRACSDPVIFFFLP